MRRIALALVILFGFTFGVIKLLKSRGELELASPSAEREVETESVIGYDITLVHSALKHNNII